MECSPSERRLSASDRRLNRTTAKKKIKKNKQKRPADKATVTQRAAVGRDARRRQKGDPHTHAKQKKKRISPQTSDLLR